MNLNDIKLGDTQKAFLRSLVEHKSWNGSGWFWDNHSGTVRLCESLVKKGLATVEDQPGAKYLRPRRIYRPNDIAKALVASWEAPVQAARLARDVSEARARITWGEDRLVEFRAKHKAADEEVIALANATNLCRFETDRGALHRLLERSRGVRTDYERHIKSAEASIARDRAFVLLHTPTTEA